MTCHLIKTPGNIILHGGLLRMANPALKIRPVNIALARSNAWINGILVLNKTPYYRLRPTQDNYIEIKTMNQKHFLMVNEKIIYETYDLFGYTINIALNKAISKPYADFFKYY